MYRAEDKSGLYPSLGTKSNEGSRDTPQNSNCNKLYSRHVPVVGGERRVCCTKWHFHCTWSTVFASCRVSSPSEFIALLCVPSLSSPPHFSSLFLQSCSSVYYIYLKVRERERKEEINFRDAMEQRVKTKATRRVKDTHTGASCRVRFMSSTCDDRWSR